MKWSALLLLVLAALAAGGLGLWVGSAQAPATRLTQNTYLVPKLADELNSLDSITIGTADNPTVATLVRNPKGWVVKERNDYPANVGKLRRMLLMLAETQLVEQKTSRAKYYSRLGVSNPDQNDAAGTLLAIDGLASPVGLIIGKTASSGGSYVRRRDDKTTWLVDHDLTLATDTLNWLDRDIIDIPTARVRKIHVQPMSGKEIIAVRPARGSDHFEVRNVPAGRKLSSKFAVNRVAAAITGLRFNGVAANSDLPADTNIVEYQTYDGLVITARLFKHDNAPYAHFNIRYDKALAQQGQDAVDNTGNDNNNQANSPGNGGGGDDSRSGPEMASNQSEPVQEMPKEHAMRVNGRVNPWVYQVPDIAYKGMTLSMADILKSKGHTASKKPQE